MKTAQIMPALPEKADEYMDLAATIASVFREKHCCTQTDLFERGCDPDTVQRYWALAYALARVQLGTGDA